MRTGYYGQWKGHYPDYDKVVEIAQEGHMLVARKVTGSSFVEGGEVTFVFDLTDLSRGIGYARFEDSSERHGVPATLTVIDRDRIRVVWELSVKNPLGESETLIVPVDFTRLGV